MIKILPKFKPDDIRKIIAERKQLIDKQILSRLQSVGEKFLANVRSSANYNDSTGNLLSSCGYVIMKDGQQLFENFAGSAQQGVSAGKQAAEEAASNIPAKGFALIGVAGMDYALSTEAQGFDVITSSAIKLKTDLEKAMHELTGK